MAIIKQLNKKTGITYVYESRSYRDKTTKQPRSERKLIGRIDDATGEIVPTRKKQKIVTTSLDEAPSVTTEGNCPATDIDLLREKDAIITQLRREISRLQKEKEDIASELERLLKSIRP